MKLTINKKENEDIKVGDFLIVHDEGCAPEIRQIVKYKGFYIGIDPKDGEWGYDSDSLKDLIEQYKECYAIVIPVKNSEVELVIGGK